MSRTCLQDKQQLGICSDNGLSANFKGAHGISRGIGIEFKTTKMIKRPEKAEEVLQKSDDKTMDMTL